MHAIIPVDVAGVRDVRKAEQRVVPRLVRLAPWEAPYLPLDALTTPKSHPGRAAGTVYRLWLAKQLRVR